MTRQAVRQAQDKMGALDRAVFAWETKGETFTKQKDEAAANVEALNKDAAVHGDALEILRKLEKVWRGSFEDALAAVVSRGLTAVFGEEMTLNVESGESRGIASVTLSLTTGGTTTPIVGSKGGSVINVLTLLLRVLLTVSARPTIRHLLVLDEPFSHVSAEYRPALCTLLRELCGRFCMQIILVSHEEEMLDAADTAYLVEKKGGVAALTPVTRPCYNGSSEGGTDAQG